jgi:hypothetical protein
MKIGITLGLKDNKESIWTNGIKQNVLILVNLLKKSSKNYDVYILNTIDVDWSEKPDYLKDINVFTIYKTIVTSAQTIVFDRDGFLKVYNTSVTSETPILTFGPNSSYVPVPGYYKLVLENSGNLAIYDSQIATTVSDLGNILFNSNSTTTYDSNKTSLLNGYTNAAAPYAFQNYRWICRAIRERSCTQHTTL